MNGGYIIMPESLSNKLMNKLLTNTSSGAGIINGLTEVCQFLDNASKIGKPVIMSGVFRHYTDQTIYTDYYYCCYISLGLNNTFMLSKDGEAFVLKITDVLKGTISYHGIDRT